eukprot:917880-Amorphochlora_amoeboformis.AAC.1
MYTFEECFKRSSNTCTCYITNTQHKCKLHLFHLKARAIRRRVWATDLGDRFGRQIWATGRQIWVTDLGDGDDG